MTLLLGPPASGKTTLLLALAGKLSHSLKVLNLRLFIVNLTKHHSVGYSLTPLEYLLF